MSTSECPAIVVRGFADTTVRQILEKAEQSRDPMTTFDAAASYLSIDTSDVHSCVDWGPRSCHLLFKKS